MHTWHELQHRMLQAASAHVFRSHSGGGGHIIVQHVKILTYRKSNGQQSIIAIVLQLGLDIVRLLKRRNIAMSASFHTISGYFWVRLLGQQTIFVRLLTHQTTETSDYRHVTTLLQAFDEGVH